MLLLQTVSLQDKHNLVSSYGSETVFYYLYLIITFFAIGTISIILYSLILGTIKAKREKRLNDLRQRYALFFAEWVLQDDDEDGYEQKKTPESYSLLLTDKDTTNAFCRNVLKEQILLLHKNILGTEAKRLRNYYKALGFPSAAYKQLKSKSKYAVIEALTELKQMDIAESYAQIAPLITHKDADIATAAFCSAVQISLPDAIHALHQPWILSDWQQHLMHNALAQVPNNDLPNFEQWLHHPSETVVLFAVRMINTFNQTPPTTQLLTLLNQTPTQTLQIALVKTLCSLGEPNVVQPLIDFYEQHINQTAICTEIINQLQWLPYPDTIQFLQQQLLVDNVVLQKASANTLAHINRHVLINVQNHLDTQNVVLHQIIKAALYATKAA